MCRVSLFVTATLTVVAASCGPAPAPEDQDQGAARADTVGLAMQAFDPSALDDVTWSSDEERTERGRVVFSISCSKCHGPSGRGDGGFVYQGDTLRPPSFVDEEWEFADAPMQLRRYIFSGNVAGMPYWGLVGLKYRDIDAVAHFIETALRQGVMEP